jgi:8-oxo-dGTP diphosphatase
MHVYLVRHAKAGSRSDWDGPDDLRPLSKKGQRQAGALVDVLSTAPVKRIISSPSVRCVQTVEPLAEKLGLEVEADDVLAEGSRLEDVLPFLEEAEEGTVICSHGDVIPMVLDSLVQTGRISLPTDYAYAKGSVWEIEGNDGATMDARYIPPPA